MKYKILINGDNSTIVKDFFRYTEKYFRCLTTSNLWQDLVGHFEIFQPDVYVVFPESSRSEMIDRINSIKSSKAYNSAPIVIVAKQETCDVIRKESPMLADLLVKRPISPDNLALSIIDFLEKEAEEKEAENAPAPADVEEKKHILVVDDDRTVLKILKTALGEKYEVTAMLNGVLVEKALASKPVDLVILDYEMPIMTGAEVFRKIKDNPDTKNIPVCFLTGVSERSKVEEIMSLRPRGYLLKPINMEMLLATISNLTNQ